jgi:hypothetical protein
MSETALSTHEASRAVQGHAMTRAGLLRPIAPVGEIVAAQNEARAFLATALQSGRDHGVIPGTGDKATLLKPGAERICAGFGVRVHPEIVEQEIDHDREVPWTKRKRKWLNRFQGDREFEWETERGVSYGLYRFVVRVTLYQIDTGLAIGSGIGSCSTMESKYVDRPRDAENTVLKMAKKRGLIDATLTTFGLSDQFTQDLDDFREDVTQAVEVVVLAGDEQLDELRDLAKQVNVTAAKWLEDKIAEGIPLEAVPVVYRTLNSQLQEKNARRRQQAQEREPGEEG